MSRAPVSPKAEGSLVSKVAIRVRRTITEGSATQGLSEILRIQTIPDLQENIYLKDKWGELVMAILTSCCGITYVAVCLYFAHVIRLEGHDVCSGIIVTSVILSQLSGAIVDSLYWYPLSVDARFGIKILCIAGNLLAASTGIFPLMRFILFCVCTNRTKYPLNVILGAYKMQGFIQNALLITPMIGLQIGLMTADPNLDTIMERPDEFRLWLGLFMASMSLLALNVSRGIPGEKRSQLSFGHNIVRFLFIFTYVFTAAGSRIAVLVVFSEAWCYTLVYVFLYHSLATLFYLLDDPDVSPEEKTSECFLIVVASSLTSNIVFINIRYKLPTFLVINSGTFLENMLLLGIAMQRLTEEERQNSPFVSTLIASFVSLLFVSVIIFLLLKLLLSTHISNQ